MYELQNGFRMALKPFNLPHPPLVVVVVGWLGGGRVLHHPSVFCFYNPQSSILSFLFSQSSILNPQFSGFLVSSKPKYTTDNAEA